MRHAFLPYRHAFLSTSSCFFFQKNPKFKGFFEKLTCFNSELKLLFFILNINIILIYYINNLV